MARIRLILEYEQRERPLDDAYIERAWGQPESPDELLARPQFLGYEQEMVAALRATPQIYRQMWVYKLLSDLHGIEWEPGDVLTQQLQDGQASQHHLLAKLLPQLSPAAQQYFRENELLADQDFHGPLAEDLQVPQLVRIIMEDEVGFLASSDQPPSPYRWQPDPDTQQGYQSDPRQTLMMDYQVEVSDLRRLLKGGDAYDGDDKRAVVAAALAEAKQVGAELTTFGNLEDDGWRTCALQLVHELGQACQLARQLYQLP